MAGGLRKCAEISKYFSTSIRSSPQTRFELLRSSSLERSVASTNRRRQTKKRSRLQSMQLLTFRLSFSVRSKQMHPQRIEKKRRQRPKLAVRRDFQSETARICSGKRT